MIDCVYSAAELDSWLNAFVAELGRRHTARASATAAPRWPPRRWSASRALSLQGAPAATPASVASALINNSTKNVVQNAGTGSPNRLLFTNY